MPQPERRIKVTKAPLGLGQKRAKEIYAYTIAHQGGTFTAFGLPVRPEFGFVLSIDPDRGIVVPTREFSPTTLEVFAMNNQPYLIDYNRDMVEPMRGLKFIGTWVFNDEVHIDVVTVIITKDVNRVMALAADNGQKAVWDFSTGKEVFVDDFFQEEYDNEVAVESAAQV